MNSDIKKALLEIVEEIDLEKDDVELFTVLDNGGGGLRYTIEIVQGGKEPPVAASEAC